MIGDMGERENVDEMHSRMCPAGFLRYSWSGNFTFGPVVATMGAPVLLRCDSISITHQ